MRTDRKTFKRKTVADLFLLIILVCIFLGSLNLINRYYYCVYIAALFFVLTPGRKMYINATFAVLLFLSMSVLLFNPDSQNMLTNMIKPFTFPLCYIMGTSIFAIGERNDIDLIKEEKNTSTIIYVLTSGVMAHFLLNLVTNRDVTDRNVIDFWTQSAMSATGQATLSCLMIGIAAAFLFSDVGLKKKLIAIAALLLIMLYNLILAGRTIFVLIAIMIAFAFLCKCIITKKKMFKTAIILLAVILVLVVVYNADVFGIKSTVEASNFYNRFMGDDPNNQELNDDARMTHKLAYLKYFLEYPWGGGNIRALYGHSAHDLYLDTYDESGIFALVAIVVYIISSLVRMVKCLKSKMLTFETRLLVACTYLVCNIQFWLEPIMRGIPWLLASYCFVDGAVTYLLSREKLVRTAKRKQALNKSDK